MKTIRGITILLCSIVIFVFATSCGDKNDDPAVQNEGTTLNDTASALANEEDASLIQTVGWRHRFGPPGPWGPGWGPGPRPPMPGPGWGPGWGPRPLPGPGWGPGPWNPGWGPAWGPGYYPVRPIAYPVPRYVSGWCGYRRPIYMPPVIVERPYPIVTGFVPGFYDVPVPEPVFIPPQPICVPPPVMVQPRPLYMPGCIRPPVAPLVPGCVPNCAPPVIPGCVPTVPYSYDAFSTESMVVNNNGAVTRTTVTRTPQSYSYNTESNIEPRVTIEAPNVTYNVNPPVLGPTHEYVASNIDGQNTIQSRSIYEREEPTLAPVPVLADSYDNDYVQSSSTPSLPSLYGPNEVEPSDNTADNTEPQYVVYTDAIMGYSEKVYVLLDDIIDDVGVLKSTMNNSVKVKADDTLSKANDLKAYFRTLTKAKDALVIEQRDYLSKNPNAKEMPKELHYAERLKDEVSQSVLLFEKLNSSFDLLYNSLSSQETSTEIVKKLDDEFRTLWAYFYTSPSSTITKPEEASSSVSNTNDTQIELTLPEPPTSDNTTNPDPIFQGLFQ